MITHEPLMTVGDVAQFFKVAPATVRRWTDSGQLKCYRVGSKKERRFEKKDVLDYLKKDK